MWNFMKRRIFKSWKSTLLAFVLIGATVYGVLAGIIDLADLNQLLGTIFTGIASIWALLREDKSAKQREKENIDAANKKTDEDLADDVTRLANK